MEWTSQSTIVNHCMHLIHLSAQQVLGYWLAESIPIFNRSGSFDLPSPLCKSVLGRRQMVAVYEVRTRGRDQSDQSGTRFKSEMKEAAAEVICG